VVSPLPMKIMLPGQTAAEKLALFEKLKARGGFAGEDRAELLEVERSR
jgi:hypothetical protein